MKNNIDIYLEGDKKAFLLSKKILIENGYFPCRKKSSLLKWIPSFEKVNWRSDDLAISSTLNKYGLSHQAMHVLVGLQVGWEYKNRPCVAIFSEAAAGCVEIYQELSRSARLGPAAPPSQTFIRYSQRAKKIKIPLKKVYSSGLKNPFSEYQKIVRDYYEIILMLYQDQLKSSQDTRSSSEWVNKMKKFKRFVYLHEKDFGNFILFILAFCGRSSSKEDQRDVKILFKILDESKSMIEFMNQLQNI